ncbi:hypothetical protein Bca101_029583 [Brassica carinata]
MPLYAMHETLRPSLQDGVCVQEREGNVDLVAEYIWDVGIITTGPLQGVLNFQSGFKPQDTDIILTSYPKSGTTWLKALTVTLLERAQNHSSSSSHDEHPLLCDNPHGIVPFLEFDVFLESSSPNLAKFSASPRLFSTHMPLHAMQENLNPSACKIVYVCRNVKDTLISWYGEMKTEPRDEINKLADFLGCPFTRQEEENGFVDEVLDLCSLPNLSGLEG